MNQMELNAELAVAASAIDEDGLPDAVSFNQAIEEASRYLDPDAYDDDPCFYDDDDWEDSSYLKIHWRVTGSEPDAARLPAQNHFGEVYDSLRSHIYCWPRADLVISGCVAAR